MTVQGLLASAVAGLILAGGAQSARAGPISPAIQMGQIGDNRPISPASIRMDNAAAPRTNLTISPIPAGTTTGSKTTLAQPRAAFDRCEAILLGRTPPVEGLDCSESQFERLRQIMSERTGAPPVPTTVDIDSLAKDLDSNARAPEGIDPTTGAPTIMILSPRG
ncbi:hypothetical protein [Phenylobacterium sp.]|uniref:hypothetical protein n=1 Tax=Phenylobacterium sp. TaxID=1871053 RepID=UPI0030F45A88